MPQTGVGKVVKKVVKKQPSQKALEDKKGGNVKVQEQSTSTSGTSGDDKKKFLHGTTSGSGHHLTGATTFDSPNSPYSEAYKAAKQARQEKKAQQKIKQNQREFGIGDQVQRPKPKPSGGTPTRERGRGGGGGGIGDRFTGGQRDTGRQGPSDGGRLAGAFRDNNLVGSQNDIEEFDGSTFSGGGFDESGGGGGSGSALAGRESVGLAKVQQGESVEDVVYGVRKRGRKVSRARGE